MPLLVQITCFGCSSTGKERMRAATWRKRLTIKSMKNQDRVNVKDILGNVKLGVRNSRHTKTRRIRFSLQTIW